MQKQSANLKTQVIVKRKESVLNIIQGRHARHTVSLAPVLLKHCATTGTLLEFAMIGENLARVLMEIIVGTDTHLSLEDQPIIMLMWSSLF